MKDLLGLKDVHVEDLKLILDTAVTMKEFLLKNAKRMPHLQGRSVFTLFYENSTRTRMSFELAAKFLGASTSSIAAATSSVQKGETLIDTGKTLDAMRTDVIIIRHPMSGAPKLLADHVKCSVVNAGDGMNEHPTQALLDIFTMREKFGNIEGLNVSIIGDIEHSRVARSNYWGLTKLGASVTFFSPNTLLPKKIASLNVTVASNKYDAVRDADVVMGLRVQKERMAGGLLSSEYEYNQYFGVDEETLRYAKEDALIMHPGPVNRGVEMTSGVIDGAQSVINEQVTNGIAIRMAVLYLLTRG